MLTNSSPTITSITPGTGDVRGGTSVVIAGTNLSTPTSVTLGGVAGTVTASTANSITVRTPAHASASVNVVVTAAAGSVTAKDAFAYVPGGGGGTPYTSPSQNPTYAVCPAS